jgi:hypothetical protein
MYMCMHVRTYVCMQCNLCMCVYVCKEVGMLRRRLFHGQTSTGKDQVSGSARRELKTRKKQCNTVGLWQPGYMALNQSGKDLTEVSKSPGLPS